jgi:hypothetical protein
VKEMNDVYPQATITPFHATQHVSVRYKVEVDGPQPFMWANIGDYDILEDAIAAFTPPLCIERQVEALQALREGRKFTFSLSDLSL